MIHKKISISILFIGVILWGVVSQDIDHVFALWRFPEKPKEFVDGISKKYGIGHCGIRMPDTMNLTSKDIAACFMSAKLTGEDTWKSDNPLEDISYLFYTCRNSEIYGEVTYVFYGSSSDYQCVAKVDHVTAKDGHLDTQVMVPSPPDPTFLVRLSAKLYTLLGVRE